MLLNRRLARQRLRLCSRDEYASITHDAHLSPLQQLVLDMYIVKRRSITNIAFRLTLSDASVRRHLADAYDKLCNFI